MKNSLVKNAFFNSLYMLLNVVFPIISYSYLARVLGTEGVGISSAAQTNVSYFVVLATLGIPAYGIREIAKAQGDKEIRDRVFSELFIINTVLTLCSSFLFVFCLFNIKQFVSNSDIYCIYGISIILNFINVDWFYQGMEQYTYIAIRSIFIKIASLIVLFCFVKNKNDINIFALINVLSISSNYLFNVYNLRNKVSIKFSVVNLSQHFKPLIYLTLCTISTELYYRMDITMLDVMADSSTVGVYTYSHRAINLIVVFLTSATAVLFPRLNVVYENDKERFGILVKNGFQLLLFITFPCFLGIIATSNEIITIWLGSGFILASKCLRILAIMIPIKCIGSLLCYQVLMCAGKESLLMKSYFLTMILNFIANWILIPLYGANGAAIASVFAEICAFIFVFFFSRKLIGDIFEWTTICKVIVASIIMFGSVLLLLRLLEGLWIKFVVVVLLGGLEYIIINLLLKNQILFFLLNVILKRRAKKNSERNVLE